MRRVRIGLAALLCLAFAGCRTPEPPPERDDFASACRAAVALRLDPRTFEMLSRAAELVVARERQLAQYAYSDAYFRVFGASSDPRFVWAHEAECYVRLAGAVDPEERMREVARKLLIFEQAHAWAVLAEFRELPRSDARLESALIALAISTGWPESRMMAFDFDSLPAPDKEPAYVFPARSVEVCGAELLSATRKLLSLAAASPRDAAATEAALTQVRDARIALAEAYLRRAWRDLGSGATPAALSGWRIAQARYELERSFPGL